MIRVKNAITAAVKKNVTPAIKGFPAADKLILNKNYHQVAWMGQKLTNMQPQQQHQPFPVRMKKLERIYYQDLIREIRSFQKKKNEIKFQKVVPFA